MIEENLSTLVDNLRLDLKIIADNLRKIAEKLEEYAGRLKWNIQKKKLIGLWNNS